MGKLRVEPKEKPLDQSQYRELCTMLKEARHASTAHHVFYDLEKDEEINEVKRNLLHVSQKEGIEVSIRRQRNQKSLALKFSDMPGPEKVRVTADDYKEKVIDVLKQAGRPLKKGEIVSLTGLSPASWNIRVREMVTSGDIKRMGNRRDATYTL